MEKLNIILNVCLGEISERFKEIEAFSHEDYVDQAIEIIADEQAAMFYYIEEKMDYPYSIVDDYKENYVKPATMIKIEEAQKIADSIFGEQD